MALKNLLSIHTTKKRPVNVKLILHTFINSISCQDVGLVDVALKRDRELFIR